MYLRAYPLWLQFISVLLIVAAFVAVTPTQVEAVTFEPVFYYYHSDQLGSSSVLTDHGGNQVDHIGYKAFGQGKGVGSGYCHILPEASRSQEQVMRGQLFTRDVPSEDRHVRTGSGYLYNIG